MSGKLIFVYNADSGLINGLRDLIHKNLSPGTYQCSLCAVTYDNLGMRREWRQFVGRLGREVEFLHRDELAEKYAVRDVPLPAVFEFHATHGPRLWLDAEQMNSCKSLGDLMRLVHQNLPSQTIFSNDRGYR